MCKICPFFLVLGLLFGGADQAQGVAVENLPISESSPTNSGYTFNWDYVYNVKGSSGVAVDHYWLLTAAHVGDDFGSNLVVNGETYTQQEVVFHSKASDPDGNATADIALIRYDKSFPGYYPLADTVPLLDELVICGFGHAGYVISSQTLAYFTDNGGPHNIKRWGTNKIDYELSRTYSAPDVGMTTSLGFNISISTRLSESGKTAYEAGCNFYDSGGGLFYNDGGTWKLAGHMTLRYGSSNQYTGNFAVATKYYVNWIKSVIVNYDTDMDWLPDWYETQYAVDATSMVANVDSDGDGFSNYEEWIADTDPTNVSSYFMVDVYSNATTLAFTSSSSREYRVEFRHDLSDTNESWQVVPGLDWFPGADSQTVTNVTADSSNCFYRVNVKLP